MSDTLKHILIALLFFVLAWVAFAFIHVVPVAMAPFLAAAISYFAHYYLENAPAGPTLPLPTVNLPLATTTASLPATTVPQGSTPAPAS